MPRTARILQFPKREARAELLSQEEVQALAESYLAYSGSERPEDLKKSCFDSPDVLLGICSLLKESCDANPGRTAREAIALNSYLLQTTWSVGLFDERDYLLGETALLAAGASRLLGNRDDAELWLDRAEAAFRNTVNPAPLLANVAYAKLTLHYDMRRYERVFEFVPSLLTSFRKLGMEQEGLKCRFLEAACLKESGKPGEALGRLEAMDADPVLQNDEALQSLVLANIAELLFDQGRYSDGTSFYTRALRSPAAQRQPLTLGHLKAVFAQALRAQGRLPEAVEAYRSAISEYLSAGMATLAAYGRVVLAETLLALDRHREAEWEILAALPTIEEQKMVPEGFAAVALLKEAVRLRKTDPNALRELREHLQAANQK